MVMFIKVQHQNIDMLIYGRTLPAVLAFYAFEYLEIFSRIPIKAIMKTTEVPP